MKNVWRFNLAPGVEPAAFFDWLSTNVWQSSANYGCSTRAFRIEGAPHAYGTEATWPDDAARIAWQASPAFAAIPNYPGFDTPWAAQQDLEMCTYRELTSDA